MQLLAPKTPPKLLAPSPITTAQFSKLNVTEPEDLTYEEQVEATAYVAAVEATYDEYGNELTAEVPEVVATYTMVTRTKTWSAYWHT